MAGYLALPSLAFAAIPALSYDLDHEVPGPRSLDLTCHSSDFSKGLDASIIEPIHSVSGLSYADVSQMIPKDLVATNDGSQVASRIADYSMNNWFNSPAFRNSSLGRSATTVEKAMTTNVAIVGSEPDSVKHEFKFAMQPTQTRAVVAYSGYTNAQLSYKVTESKMDFEVHEQVAALGSQVVYNHTVKPGDNVDMLSLRWVW